MSKTDFQRIVGKNKDDYYVLENGTEVRLRKRDSFVYKVIDYKELKTLLCKDNDYFTKNIIYIDDIDAITKEDIKIEREARRVTEMSKTNFQQIVKSNDYYVLQNGTEVRLNKPDSVLYKVMGYEELEYYANDVYFTDNIIYIDDTNAITRKDIEIAREERRVKEMKWDEFDESQLTNIMSDINYLKNKLDPLHREYSNIATDRAKHQVKLSELTKLVKELEDRKSAVSIRDSKKGGFRKKHKKSVKNSTKRAIKSRKYKNRK
jgi:hypothetical protein